MKTCKDCLHSKACRDWWDEQDDKNLFSESNIGCELFIDRSEWVHLPCEKVYFICDRNTKFATVMSKSIKNLSVHEIEEIDKSGYYFSTTEKAEKALERKSN